MIRIVSAGIAALSFSLVGCTPSSKEPAAPTTPSVDVKAPEVKTTGVTPATPAANPAAAVAAAAAAVAQTVEIACAGCIYKMPDAKGCSPAVKIAGKAYHAEIPNFNAHNAGLCTAAKQAQITGELKGDKFVASKIELK